MNSMKLALVILLVFTSLPTLAAKRFVYEDKAFARKITMTFEMKERAEDQYDLNLDLKIKVLGVKLGNMSERTFADRDFVPLYDSRCRSPKRSGRQFNCYSSKYLEPGEFLVSEFNGSTPRINTNLNNSNAAKILMKKHFPEFDMNRDNVYNLTSLYFLTLNEDFGMRDDQRVLYVHGAKELFKIKLKVAEKKKSELAVTLDVLGAYSENEEGQFVAADGPSSSTLPGKFIYSQQRRVVTSLHLKTSKNTYVLKLK